MEDYVMGIDADGLYEKIVDGFKKEEDGNLKKISGLIFKLESIEGRTERSKDCFYNIQSRLFKDNKTLDKKFSDVSGKVREFFKDKKQEVDFTELRKEVGGLDKESLVYSYAEARLYCLEILYKNSRENNKFNNDFKDKVNFLLHCGWNFIFAHQIQVFEIAFQVYFSEENVEKAMEAISEVQKSCKILQENRSRYGNSFRHIAKIRAIEREYEDAKKAINKAIQIHRNDENNQKPLIDDIAEYFRIILKEKDIGTAFSETREKYRYIKKLSNQSIIEIEQRMAVIISKAAEENKESIINRDNYASRYLNYIEFRKLRFIINNEKDQDKIKKQIDYYESLLVKEAFGKVDKEFLAVNEAASINKNLLNDKNAKYSEILEKAEKKWQKYWLTKYGNLHIFSDIDKEKIGHDDFLPLTSQQKSTYEILKTIGVTEDKKEKRALALEVLNSPGGKLNGLFVLAEIDIDSDLVSSKNNAIKLISMFLSSYKNKFNSVDIALLEGEFPGFKRLLHKCLLRFDSFDSLPNYVLQNVKNIFKILEYDFNEQGFSELKKEVKHIDYSLIKKEEIKKDCDEFKKINEEILQPVVEEEKKINEEILRPVVEEKNNDLNLYEKKEFKMEKKGRSWANSLDCCGVGCVIL